MEKYYTAEKNVQMLVSLLKAHGIKKVIASPGTTNVTFVASLQIDPYFEIYSAVDERSAAYMACGLAAESGEPVVLSCTGATASRNYVPGLTEAFYRKLPVLAVTSTQHTGKVGQLVAQVMDRSVIQNDIAVMSVDIPSIYSADDEWSCNVKLNSAILALKHRGGGPVHINLTTTYSRDFSVKELPKYRVINRITNGQQFPKIQTNNVGIFVGAHLPWSEELTTEVDEFCEKYNGMVICDHTSNYHGKYRIQYNLLAGQTNHRYDAKQLDLLIDMGEVSGSYMGLTPKEVWRVNPDGAIRDTFRKLKYLFDMDEIDFFKRINKEKKDYCKTTLYELYHQEYDSVYSQIPELPFSNIWMAYTSVKQLPNGSILHLGILNSLRSWNFFELDSSVSCYTNTGGFGIDGLVSTLIGASLASSNKLHFLVVGDLAFFYDLNSVANRHVGNNIRILLINNGLGTEFRNYSHFAAQFGEDANMYMAAAGHYGQKSPVLVKHYAEDLGFEYITADSKESFIEVMPKFFNSEIEDKPVLFEVFTTPENESDALKVINHIVVDPPTMKDKVRNVIGENGVSKIKKILGR